ncbi:splicing factor 3B subunit 6 isoform X2 [Lynx rufus]|uniref:splicing factor 3B subunit 6 isoform X2 n=1 Tax=Lynx rufus TaxID=61384 RepID=UPI001F1232D6|nr:splicing factor 3B subunit 6 isoform X2 [Lynx rufus]
MPFIVTGAFISMTSTTALCGVDTLFHRGNTPETRGTAYVVYEDIFDAKNACDHLSGFNVCNRYLVVLYYNANRAFQKMDTKKKEEQLKLLKEKYGINTDPPK